MDKITDLTFLKSFTSGDQSKLTKYITMFVNGAQGSLEQMKQHMAAGEWPSLKTSAHSIKSQVKYMGIRDAEELAIAIEKNAGEQSNLEHLPEMISKLEDITNRACLELKDELGKL